MIEFGPYPADPILGIRVTLEDRFEMSNNLKALSPFEDQNVADGIGVTASRGTAGKGFREADAASSRPRHSRRSSSR
jgi:hypothetical protein